MLTRASDASMIEVHGLVKWFGELEVLSGITLRVERGEVAAVIGPSGCGKSTFLRCLNGLERLDGGVIRIAGTELQADLGPREMRTRLAAVRRRVGMVFQQFHLFPHLTALGNVVEAPVHVLLKSRDEATAEATALLDRVGLNGKAHHTPDTLSGGQQQRVAIARAMAMQPDVILFDEPTSALDPHLAAEVEAVITDLAESGQTMVVVTHSIALARRAARTLHMFDAGKLVESGSPEQIFSDPKQESTRRFVAQARAL